MNNYIKSLEESNEEYQRNVILLEDIIDSYKNIEFIFEPIYNGKKKLIRLYLKLSYKTLCDSMVIAILEPNKKEKNRCWIRLGESDIIDNVEIPYNDDVYVYINYMLKYLDMNHIKNIIVV